MDGNLATTYTLVHAFLVKRAHLKAAQALKKSVKQFLILKDDCTPEGPSLDDIIRSWKPRPKDGHLSSKAKLNKTPSESESSNAGSLSDSSDDESSDSESDKKLKATTLKAKRASDSGSVETPKKKEIKHEKHPKKSISSISNKVKAATKIKGKASSSRDDSTSDSDSSSDSDAQPKTIPKSSTKARASSTSSSSSSSSEESDRESQLKPKSKKGDVTTTTRLNSKVENGKTSSSAPVRVIKKRRTDVEGHSVATAITGTIPSQEVREESGSKVKPDKTLRTTDNRFSRVNPSKIQPIADNSYVAKNAPMNDYGKRAHQDLIVTRGSGFRKEKNKKKRGSYRGGEITMESHSFKFTYD